MMVGMVGKYCNQCMPAHPYNTSILTTEASLAYHCHCKMCQYHAIAGMRLFLIFFGRPQTFAWYTSPDGAPHVQE